MRRAHESPREASYVHGEKTLKNLPPWGLPNLFGPQILFFCDYIPPFFGGVPKKFLHGNPNIFGDIEAHTKAAHALQLDQNSGHFA